MIGRLFIFILITLVSRISLTQFAVIKIPDERKQSFLPENVFDNATEPTYSDTDGDDYAIDIVGDVIESQINLGCDDDIDIFGNVIGGEINYNCGNRLKTIVKVWDAITSIPS